MDEFNSKAVDLALVVIAKNESHNIKKCLLSAKNIVTKMVVLDTGSTDETIEISKSCGAVVGTKKWNGSFSEARNAALKLADADWNLVIDADEWIESCDEKLLSSLFSGKVFLGDICIKSYHDKIEEHGPSITWVSRLLPRGVSYSGRIHEQPVSSLSRIPIPIIIGHDGYLNSALEKKRGRNRKILEDELKNNPNNPYLLYQLAKDYDVYDDLTSAGVFYSAAYNAAPLNSSYRYDLCISFLSCLSRAGKLEDALLIADEIMGDFTQSPDYYFLLGNLFTRWAKVNPDEALDRWLPLAEDAWLKCLELGDSIDVSGTRLGSGGFSAARNLYVLFDSFGYSEKAIYYKNLMHELKSKICLP